MEPECELVTNDPVMREPEDKGLIYPVTMQHAHAETYCEVCDICLNGPTQWEDHKRGKKHRKNKGQTRWVKLRNVISGEELACRANNISRLRRFVQKTVLTNNPGATRHPKITFTLGTKVLHDEVCLDELADTEEELWNLVIDYIVLQS